MPFRRDLVAALLLLPACSVLPDRPYVEPRRFPLTPERPPGNRRRGRRRRVLLVRVMRAAPGLDSRGLRTLRADGTLNTDFYSEWTAPPAELAEEAIRRWLGASGLFSAVVAPGSRARPDLVLETELTALVAEPALRRARAGIAGVVLGEGSNSPGQVLGQFTVEGTAPLEGDAPDAAAAAMTAAFSDALTELEARVAAFS